MSNPSINNTISYLRCFFPDSGVLSAVVLDVQGHHSGPLGTGKPKTNPADLTTVL